MCVGVCIYIYIYTHTYTSLSLSLSLYIYIYIHMYTYIHMCMHPLAGRAPARPRRCPTRQGSAAKKIRAPRIRATKNTERQDFGCFPLF